LRIAVCEAQRAHNPWRMISKGAICVNGGFFNEPIHGSAARWENRQVAGEQLPRPLVCGKEIQCLAYRMQVEERTGDTTGPGRRSWQPASARPCIVNSMLPRSVSPSSSSFTPRNCRPGRGLQFFYACQQPLDYPGQATNVTKGVTP